ncbi:hypothetical protein HT031_002249 [Scenedesmus sp. PABB004]|nr:hypothetical protein HT031_002249 [Scenedesmus sp. PABB004]
MHRFEVMLGRKAEGKTGRAFIGDMTEEKSVELASKLASESFLFLVGSLIIFAEYERTRRKEVAKQAKESAERHAILERAREERERLLAENIEQQRMLERLLTRLDAVEAALSVQQEERGKGSSAVLGAAARPGRPGFERGPALTRPIYVDRTMTGPRKMARKPGLLEPLTPEQSAAAAVAIMALPDAALDAAAALMKNVPAEVQRLLLERAVLRWGKGGRPTLPDPRLDPDMDPAQAARIASNREAAACSKLKNKLAKEVQVYLTAAKAAARQAGRLQGAAAASKAAKSAKAKAAAAAKAAAVTAASAAAAAVFPSAQGGAAPPLLSRSLGPPGAKPAKPPAAAARPSADDAAAARDTRAKSQAARAAKARQEQLEASGRDPATYHFLFTSHLPSAAAALPVPVRPHGAAARRLPGAPPPSGPLPARAAAAAAAAAPPPPRRGLEQDGLPVKRQRKTPQKLKDDAAEDTALRRAVTSGRRKVKPRPAVSVGRGPAPGGDGFWAAWGNGMVSDSLLSAAAAAAAAAAAYAAPLDGDDADDEAAREERMMRQLMHHQEMLRAQQQQIMTLLAPHQQRMDAAARARGGAAAPHDAPGRGDDLPDVPAKEEPKAGEPEPSLRVKQRKKAPMPAPPRWSKRLQPAEACAAAAAAAAAAARAAPAARPRGVCRRPHARMGFGAGVGWALIAALAHTAIDVLRKLGAQRLAPLELVALVAIYDALLATAGVWLVEGRLPALAALPDPQTFALVVFITSSLSLCARLFYQRALSLAPLSLTVPFLAFTPVFVIAVSPLFLGRTEIPSPMGLVGVVVVSASGFALGRVGAGGAAGQPGSPSKLKLPLTAAPPGGWQQHAAPAAPAQQAQQQHRQEQQLQHRQEHQLQHRQEQQHTSSTERQHLQQHGGAAAGARPGAKASSAWALAYYKDRAPRLLVAGQAQPALQPQPGGGGWPGGGGGAVAASCANGNGGWDDAPARPGKGGGDAGAAPPRRRRAAGAAGAGGGGLRALAGGASARAPAMVLSVAALYSLTASMDKLGIAAAGQRLAPYFLAQRLLVGAAAAAYLGLAARRSARHLLRDAPLLVSISLAELGAVVFYLAAIENVLVSYVVAIKRVNVLLSTLVGALAFKERVAERLPYIASMLLGMLLIVLSPGHGDLHHSHHTRR